MIELEKPIAFNKDFSITSMVESKALNTPDNLDNEQYIDVSGYASRMFKDGKYVVDADQENVNTFGFDLKRLKNGTMPLLFNHKQDQPVGKILEAKYDQEGLMIKARLYKYRDDQLTNFVYNSVKSGVISAFSVGMLVKAFDLVEQDNEEYLQLSKSEVIEVSLVAVPSNPEALFQITNLKSAGGEEGQATLLKKDVLKAIGAKEVCDGFSCAYAKHKELEAQKEEIVEVIKEAEVPESTEVEADKEVVVGITPAAMDDLEEILNPEEPLPVESDVATEGETVVPDNNPGETVDESNDKPSEEPQEDYVPEEEPKVESQPIEQVLANIDITNMSLDELEPIYEVLSALVDQIEEMAAQEVISMMQEDLVVTPAV